MKSSDGFILNYEMILYEIIPSLDRNYLTEANAPTG